MKKAFSILILILIVLSCKNDDDTSSPVNCGCDSATLDTIPSNNFPEVPIEEQTTGYMFYKSSEDIDDFYDYYVNEYYDNRFWIYQGVDGCDNCRRNFIVCNENILGTEYDYLKNSNDSTQVRFNGNRKRLCEGPIILPADYLYSEIELTLIEQL
jgi:hypothetical protein